MALSIKKKIAPAQTAPAQTTMPAGVPGAISKAPGATGKLIKKGAEQLPPQTQQVEEVDETQQIGTEYVPEVHAQAGVGTVHKQHSDGSETHEEIPMAMVQSSEPMAKVEVQLSITRNLGNYESFKATVGITLPCKADADEIDEAYNEAKGWAESRIEMINQEVDAELGQ